MVDKVLFSQDGSSNSDWIVSFWITYNNGKQLLISRNKLGTLHSQKIKEIYIAIPIPSINIVSWGVEDNQYIYGPDHYHTILKNFWVEQVDFNLFSNRTDCIYDCLRRAIQRAFFEGFTVGGIKVKDRLI